MKVSAKTSITNIFARWQRTLDFPKKPITSQNCPVMTSSNYLQVLRMYYLI